MVKKPAAEPEADLVRLYFDQIGRYPLLSRDDEVRLAQAVEAGRDARARLTRSQTLTPARRRELQRQVRSGDEATEAFVKANLRLVVAIAKRYQVAGLPLLDLVQEGNLGLIRAVEKFDWRKGFRFSTYAGWWIRQAIRGGIATAGKSVRLPLRAADLLSQVTAARGRLQTKLGRNPTTAEIAGDLGLDPSKVTEVIRHAAQSMSLSDLLQVDGDLELSDMVEDRFAVSPAEAAEQALLPGQVAKLLAALDDRERTVLQLRFGLDGSRPRTLDQVGAHFNLTREQIRRIENRAISKLRRHAVDRTSACALHTVDVL